MRSSLRALILSGSLLAVAGLAQAQTTILDTIGTGAEYGNGSTQVGQYIGADDNVGILLSGLPNSPYATASTLAGYAALPFALNANASYYALSSVTIDAQINAPTFGSSSNKLYGAFIENPTIIGGLLAPNTQVVGGFFQFDLSSATNAQGKGNNTAMELTASTGLPTLAPGNQYYLVIAPKPSLTIGASDLPAALTGVTPLTDLGVALTATSTAINAAGGGFSNGITTVDPALNADVNVGANLGFAQVGVGVNTQYYGAKIAGFAGVPEASSVATALVCLVSMGGLLRRRRAK